MSQELTYPLEGTPEAGCVWEVVPGVRWLRMALPFVLDHVNLWLLEDGQGWAAVDTGIALESVQTVWQQVLAEHPLRRLLVTHFHPDHVGLAAWLCEQQGVAMHMTLGEYLMAHTMRLGVGGIGVEPMFRQFQAHGLDAERMAALTTRGNAYARGVPALPQQFQRLQEGQILTIGAHDWRVVVGRGHAPEHASFYCQSLGILISGDMLLPRISSNISVLAAMPDSDPLRDYLDSLKALLALPDDTLVLPSHGRPFRGVHVRVQQLVSHHAERCATLAAACTEPRSACELLHILFPRALDTHQVQFAMGEAIAHLNHLEQQGALRRVQGDDGVYRFVKTH